MHAYICVCVVVWMNTVAVSSIRILYSESHCTKTMIVSHYWTLPGSSLVVYPLLHRVSKLMHQTLNRFRDAYYAMYVLLATSWTSWARAATPYYMQRCHVILSTNKHPNKQSSLTLCSDQTDLTVCAIVFMYVYMLKITWRGLTIMLCKNECGIYWLL